MAEVLTHQVIWGVSSLFFKGSSFALGTLIGVTIFSVSVKF